jgi:hypothetical protein
MVLDSDGSIALHMQHLMMKVLVSLFTFTTHNVHP